MKHSDPTQTGASIYTYTNYYSSYSFFCIHMPFRTTKQTNHYLLCFLLLLLFLYIIASFNNLQTYA